MTARSGRRAIASDTLAIVERGTFESPNGQQISIKNAQRSAQDHTQTYSPEQSEQLIRSRTAKPQEAETTFEVTAETTLDAVRRLYDARHEDVVCLNFASAKNPGGGFLGGSQAQEESLARSTGLYPCLLEGRDYYETNRSCGTCVYTDYMIYSPTVPIFKDEDGNNLDRYRHTAVITAPAVNTGVVKRQEAHRMPEVETVMKRRIEKVLAIARAHNHGTIVLGAWGCGVFQNDPEVIAGYFKEVIQTGFAQEFKHIVFAVYSKHERFINPFYAHFGD